MKVKPRGGGPHHHRRIPPLQPEQPAKDSSADSFVQAHASATIPARRAWRAAVCLPRTRTRCMQPWVKVQAGESVLARQGHELPSTSRAAPAAQPRGMAVSNAGVAAAEAASSITPRNASLTTMQRHWRWRAVAGPSEWRHSRPRCTESCRRCVRF